jgi:PKD repeat protein
MLRSAVVRSFCLRWAIVIALLGLAACGGKQAVPLNQSVPGTPAGSGDETSTASGADWHSIVVQHHDMNAASGNPHFAKISVKPQQEAVLPGGTDKAAAGLSGLAGLLPAPSRLSPAAAVRHGSDFTADDLIHDGALFDVTLPRAQATPGPESDPRVTLTSDTDPYEPQTSQAAFITYRFNLENYAASGLPQSLGTLWEQDDAPNTYFVGLSDWQLDRWAWFEGSADNVVTVASLAPYINPTDHSLLAVVLVLDNQARDLLLVQIGAEEVRGFGGAAPETVEGQDYNEPEDYYAGKTASGVNGAPAQFLLPEEKVGPVLDQGQTNMCTCCAASSMYNYELSTAYAPYWVPNKSSRRMSPKWLFKETVGGQCWAGRPPETVLDFMKNTGGATLAHAPHNQNCDVDYNAATCQADGAKLKITGWRKIRDEGQAGIDEIKNHLYNLNHPVLMLITLSDNFEDDVNAGLIYNWQGITPNLLGWHSTLIIGYNDTARCFKVRNSWGKDWGDNGDFWISYDTFSSKAWIDCFAMWTNYSSSAASYFNLTQDAAVPPATVDCSVANTDKISLDWSAVNLATGYKIYRDTKTNLIATVNSGTHYDDFGVSDFYTHTYFVQTLVESSKSASMTQGHGWRAKPQAPKISDVRIYTTGMTGAAATFATSVDNPSGAPLTCSWSFPAGAIVEASPVPQRQPGLTLGQAGSYTCTLTVSNAGGQATKNFALTVHPLPAAPVAEFTAPASALRSKVVYFDAASSVAQSGHSITRYYWDTNGDSISDFETTSTLYAQIFPKAGTYTMRLKVLDERGLISSWKAHDIQITVPPPVDKKIFGRITNGANGVAGITVNGHITGNPSPLWTAVTDGSGNYTLQGISTGLDVTVEPDAAAPYSFSPPSIQHVMNADYFGADFAATPITDWSHSLGFDGLDDAILGVASAASGNVYVAGYETDSGPVRRALLAQYSSSGQLNWSHEEWSFFGPAQFNAVAVNASAIYTVGGFTNENTFNDEILIMKWDGSGNVSWKQSWGKGSTSMGYAAALDPAGNLYVAGETNGAGGGIDIVVLKLDPASGSIIWQNTYSTPGADHVRGAAYDTASEHLVLTGWAPTSAPSPTDDVSLLKIYKDGSLGVDKLYDCGTLPEAGYGILADATSNIYICGDETAADSLSSTALMLKLAPDGTPLVGDTWTAPNASPTFHRFNSLFLTGGGDLYSAGFALDGSTSYGAVARWNTSFGHLAAVQFSKPGSQLFSVGQTANDSKLLLGGMSAGPGGSWSSILPTLGHPTPVATAYGGTYAAVVGTVNPPSPVTSDSVPTADLAEGGGDALTVKRPLL